MSKRLHFLTVFAASVLLSSCANLSPMFSVAHNNNIKNIILIIGDGMGPQQVGLLLSYARQAPHSILPSTQTAFDRLLIEGELGLALTYATDTLVTDSAASASQLATGQMARIEMLGMDSKGKAAETIVETAKKLGKATGLVSDTRITHATPAAFAAHQSHRRLENEIAADLLKTDADVMLSAGLSYWLPQAINLPRSAIQQQWQYRIGTNTPLNSKRKDNKDLLSRAEQQGYQLIFNRQQLAQVNNKVLGLFADENMQDAIEENHTKQNPQRTQPTLAEMSLKALQIVDKNPNGFFLMIEAGQIDWAGHHNDTGLLLHEMLRINETTNSVLDWLGTREDTLLIVTADHETGGFGFSYSAYNIPAAPTLLTKTDYKPNFNFGNPTVLDKLYAQQQSHQQLFNTFDALAKEQQTANKLMSLVNINSAFHINEQQARRILSTHANPYYCADHEYLNVKDVPIMAGNTAFFPYQKTNRENLLAQALANEQQTVWATGSHTSTPVYVFAKGKKNSTAYFQRLLHHTELGRLMIKVLTQKTTSRRY